MKKIIGLVNFKGGVGKSTISAILASYLTSGDKKAVVLNIAMGQSAEEFNSCDTVDLVNILAEDETTSALEILSLLKENYDYIILDTPGELSDELVEVINEIDYFVVPFDDGDRTFNDTKNCVKSIFESGIIEKEAQEHNVCFIHNKYTDAEEIKSYKKEYKKLVKSIDEPNGNSFNLMFAQLSSSKSVKTMEKKKKSIKELSANNKVAYRVFEKRVNSMSSKIEEFILEGE